MTAVGIQCNSIDVSIKESNGGYQSMVIVYFYELLNFSLYSGNAIWLVKDITLVNKVDFMVQLHVSTRVLVKLTWII